MSIRNDTKSMYAAARLMAAQVLRGAAPCSWGRTELAHEALARMLGGSWADRTRESPQQVLCALRTVIRRTLIDYQRSRQRLGNAGSTRKRVTGSTDDLPLPRAQLELEAAVEHAWLLERVRRGTTALHLRDPGAVLEVAELNLLLGLSQREVAEHTGVPQTTVCVWMKMVRAWLEQQLCSTPRSLDRAQR